MKLARKKNIKFLCSKFNIHTSWMKLSLELFVVFAGVTAGFLLNNWWVNRGNKDLENHYYSRFVEDLHADLLSLKNVYNVDSLWLEKATIMFKEYSNGRFTKENSKKTIPLISDVSFADLRSTTFHEVTNSGTWYVIKNANIVKNLHDYYVDIQNSISFTDNLLNNCYSDIINPMAFENINCLKLDFINYNEKIALKLSNMFVYCYYNRKTRMANFASYIKHVENLIEAIKFNNHLL
jgi:hypothetical protein